MRVVHIERCPTAAILHACVACTDDEGQMSIGSGGSEFGLYFIFEFILVFWVGFRSRQHESRVEEIGRGEQNKSRLGWPVAD